MSVKIKGNLVSFDKLLDKVAIEYGTSWDKEPELLTSVDKELDEDWIEFCETYPVVYGKVTNYTVNFDGSKMNDIIAEVLIKEGFSLGDEVSIVHDLF